MRVCTTAENSGSMCRSGPLRARREALIDSTAATLAEQIAARPRSAQSPVTGARRASNSRSIGN
jgi:hypothetical protein